MSLAEALRIVALTVFKGGRDRKHILDTYKVLDIVLTYLETTTLPKEMLLLWDARAKISVMLAIMESPQEFTNPNQLMGKKHEEVLAILEGRVP